MNNNIITGVVSFLIFTLNINAEENFIVDLDNPTGVEYTLDDKETTVVSIKGWEVQRVDAEDIIGMITSKGEGDHSHLIYRLNKTEMEDGLTTIALAKKYFSFLVEDAEILYEEKWDQKKVNGSQVARKTVRMKEDLDDDGKIEEVWLIVEAKEYEDRFYAQVVYHAAPVSKKKLQLIGKVMNSVIIKKEK